MKRKKQVLFSISLLIFCCLHGTAQPTLFWKISCDTCPKPSYLFGTAHFIDGDYLFQYKNLVALIFSSDAIATESGQETEDEKNIPDDSMKITIPLNQLLDSADYAFIKNLFEKYLALPFLQAEYYSPFAIGNMIDYGIALQKTREQGHLPTDTAAVPLSMDNTIEKIATVQHIPLYQMESEQEMVRIIMHETPPQQQAQLLMDRFKIPENDIRHSVDDSCYRANDLHCLCEREAGINTYSRPGDSTMVYRRNILWLQRIPGMISKQSVFIAVGSQHLCGEYGLVNQLRKMGYKLSPLEYR